MNLKFNDLLKKTGLNPSLCRFTPITGGGNNRLFRVVCEEQSYVMKSYFYHQDDKRNRLKHEFVFLKYLYENGTQTVPRPIECDFKNHIGLYEYIVGSKPTSKSVNTKNIDQFISFIYKLNIDKDKADNIPIATEACFSLDDYFKSFEWRFNRLLDLKPESEVYKKCMYFVKYDLNGKWSSVKKSIIKQYSTLNISYSEVIPYVNRCLSPSDFGFHNVIQNNKGNFVFLDFEYAGWDDPVKMVCDFCCHPGSNMPEKYWDSIIEKMLNIFPKYELNKIRTRILMPLIKLKWCCIMLNEFMLVSKERRAFSQDQVNVTDERKMEQLNKSKKLFETI